MMFAALFAIVVGAAIVGWWAIAIFVKGVPGTDVTPEAGGRGRTEMLFHWVAELATAAALVTGGVGLLLDAGWALETYLVAIGMLLYTVVNSPGYFAQRREWPMVWMFAVLVALALASLALAV